MKQINFQNDVLPLKNKLYRLALRITQNNEDAEDIVQDTLLKIWKRRASWDTIESMESYSMTICRNLSLDVLRKKEHTTAPLSTVMDHESGIQVAPDDNIIQRDKIQLVQNAINRLPEKQRTTMQLRDFEGKSYKEIAEILNISEAQVKVNIFRARQTIKDLFEKIENDGL